MADGLHRDESAQRAGTDVFAVVFERWHWVEHGLDVGSDYCQTAWLPVIGPAAWLLWGSVTRGLVKQARVEWSVPEIARFHGIGCAEVTMAIEQLARYGLAVSLAPARWRIRMRCPQVLDRTVEVPQIDAPADTQPGRRAQLWSSRNRPIASRGAR